MSLLIQQVFASFAVIRVDDKIWATTRDGIDSGRIGLPGGKCDENEQPLTTAIRESREEGLCVDDYLGTLIREALVNGKLVHWYEFIAATPLTEYKEQYRGICPILVPIHDIANSGYGNEFLSTN